MSSSTIEVIGYLASALVVASFAMRSVVRLRIISMLGSVTFIVYGAMLPSVPILITNTFVGLLNGWYLYREFSGGRELGAVPIASDAPFLEDFLRSHDSDIRTFQPDFELAPDASAWLLTRDGLPAGALIGRARGDALEVDLDYITARYRDSRLGQWLFGPGSKTLRGGGITRVVATPRSAEQRSYLTRLGFVAQGEQMHRTLG